jgi:cardiolipin synthase (CMP-forming)
MLRYLPNGLTVLRLLLAVPLGFFILRENYTAALGIGVLAGLSDAFDGFAARRLGALSHFGAALDPIADKILITVTFVCLADVGLVPWYLAAVVIARDIVIVVGAACFYLLIGPFEFAASGLSKANMCIQIGFCVLVLMAQVVGSIPPATTQVGAVLVVIAAAASGIDYVLSWARKAIQSRKTRE